MKSIKLAVRAGLAHVGLLGLITSSVFGDDKAPPRLPDTGKTASEPPGGSGGRYPREFPDCTTDVEARGVHPAGAPVLLTVTLTNPGRVAAHYWWGGPGRYPDAESFPARLTDRDGKARPVTAANGQYQMGSGTHVAVRPGEVVTFPAAIGPLPTWAYIIEVGVGKGVKVVVKEDPKLLKGFEDDLLARVRKGEPFAKWAAAAYPTPGLTTALLRDVESDDRGVATAAADVLSRDRRVKLPAEYGPSFARAITTYHAVGKSEGEPLRTLIWLAARVGTDAALDAVLPLARDDWWAGTAGRALVLFPQDRANETARGLLKHDSEDVRFEVARALAERCDRVALDVLLDVAGRAGKWRAYACEELAKYPTDKRVVPALEAALRDSDTFVRDQASRALKQVRRSGKP